MSSELIVALISAGAVVLAVGLGALGAVVGTSRNRLPARLKRASQLAGVLKSMEAGSAEQKLAQRVHDDLVSEWALEADNSYDELIAGSRGLIISGFAVVLGAWVAVRSQSPPGELMTELSSWAYSLYNAGVAILLVGLLMLAVGGLLYLLGRGPHIRNTESVRKAHNLRETVRAMNDAAMRSRRTQRRAE